MAGRQRSAVVAAVIVLAAVLPQVTGIGAARAASSGSATMRSAAAPTAPAVGAAASVASGMVTNGTLQMCVNDKQASGTPGNIVQIWKCLANTQEIWSFYDDQTLRIAGGCLAVSGGATANGTVVVLEPCASGDGSQVWAPGSGWTLVNPASGRCLADPGGSATNGTQLTIADCDGSAGQEWRLPGSAAGRITDGVTGKCADDAGNSSAAGTAVQISTCVNTSEQVWTAGSDGTVTINGECAEPAGTANDTGMQIANCDGTNTQQWAFGPTGWAENIASARCLSDPNASTTDGTQLIIYDCNGTTQQTWRVPWLLNPAGPLANGVAGECASDYQGTEAVIWSCGASSSQNWVVLNDQAITAAGLCADPTAAATANWTTIALVSCAGASGILWAEGPDGWILNVRSGRCLSDPNAATSNGTQLVIYDCNGTPQQTWTLPPTTAPAAPAGVSAASGYREATVAWRVPWSDGGTPVTSYTVTASPGGATATAAGSATSATVTGLTPGTAYTFTVTATTAVAASPASAASGSVTPTDVPAAPIDVTAQPGYSQATVTWTAPTDGGSPITSYTVTASPGGATATAAAAATSATITGLTNGTPYIFTVTASNANGAGAASAPTTSVTPQLHCGT